MATFPHLNWVDCASPNMPCSLIYNKYGGPKSLDRERFFETREKTYLAFGLNEAGLRTKKRLRRLGVEFVIPVLKEQLKAAW